MTFALENQFALKSFKILLKRCTLRVEDKIENTNARSCFIENGVNIEDAELTETGMTKNWQKSVCETDNRTRVFQAELENTTSKIDDQSLKHKSFQVFLSRSDECCSRTAIKLPAKCCEKHFNQNEGKPCSKVDLSSSDQPPLKVLKNIQTHRVRRLVAVRGARCRLGLAFKSQDFLLYSVNNNNNNNNNSGKEFCKTGEDSIVPAGTGPLKVKTDGLRISQNASADAKKVVTDEIDMQIVDAESELRPHPLLSKNVAHSSMNIAQAQTTAQSSNSSAQSLNTTKQQSSNTVDRSSSPQNYGHGIECQLCKCRFVVPRCQLMSDASAATENQRKWLCSQCKCLLIGVRRCATATLQ